MVHLRVNFMEYRWKSHASALSALFVLNLIAHFLPFERAALAPDDYQYLADHPSPNAATLLRETVGNRHRPVNHAFQIAHAWLVGDDPQRALLILFASTTILLAAVYAFSDVVLRSPGKAFVTATLFCLLPQKAEAYHTAVFSNVNLVVALYVVCLALFVRHAREGRATALGAAVTAYGVAIFWYEVGFFLPVALAGWALATRRRDLVLRTAWFAPLAVAYLAIRLTAPTSLAVGGRPAGLSWRPLVTLFHHYAGGYAFLSVVDSATLLSRLDASAIAIGFAIDAAAIALIVRMLRRVTVVPRDNAAIWFGVLIVVTSLLPLFLQRQGGVAGRHLLLPSVGLAIMATACLGSVRRWRSWVVAFCVVALPIAQGQAQAQVGACRLNAGMIAALRSRTDEVARARHVVFDLRSFTEAVPAGWLRLDFDHLNNHFGAQAFADWGLASMVRLVAQGSRPAVYFAVSTPSRGPENWHFFAGHDTGSRAFRTTRETVPISETIVVSFADLRLPK